MATQLNTTLANCGVAERVMFDNDGQLVVMTAEQKSLVTAPLPLNERLGLDDGTGAVCAPRMARQEVTQKVVAPDGE